MKRKRHSVAPHFRIPTPYDPVMGNHLPLAIFHPYIIGKAQAAGISARSDNDVGSGTVTLYILKPGDIALTATLKEVECYTLGGAVDENTFVFLIQDSYDRYWVVQNAQMQPMCWFKFDNALDTSEASESATIQTQWGDGISHDVTQTITVMNLPTHTAGVYEFYADAGDWGTASYSGSGYLWYIVIPECP